MEPKMPTEKAKDVVKSLADKEGLKKIKKAANDLGLALVYWEPERLARFAAGNLTIAALENISKEKLYEMADVGYRLLTQGKLEDAKKIFSGLAVMDPYDSYFQMVLGSIFQRSNELVRAEQHYTRVLEIDSSLVTAYANRGESRVGLGKMKEAIEDFSKAILLDPQNKDPAAMRARVMLVAINNQIQQINATQRTGQKQR
jgi:tetratricopeptide (TPR) repeat protein